MDMRVCIFVDGENFRHNIVDLFPEFSREDYLPKNAKWEEFFNWLAISVIPEVKVALSENRFVIKGSPVEAQRIRTYWYTVEHLDFSPYRIPPISKEQQTAERVFSRFEPWAKELKKISNSKEKTKKLEEYAEELVKRRDNMRHRFDGWGRIQNGISNEHRSIEFRRAGSIQYNLFERQLQKEKAVDVKLATDMIMLRDIYDVAVIVSGDQDYVPAVQVLKDSGKRVVNVSFLTHKGRELPGGARRLNYLTDWSFTVPYDTAKEFFQIGKSHENAQ